MTELAERLIIAIYNPLSRPVTQHLRVPISEPGYSVYDHLGQVIISQVNEIPEHIKDIPGYMTCFSSRILNADFPFLGRMSLAELELIFPVSVPGLGYTLVYLQREGTKEHTYVRKIQPLEDQLSFDVQSSIHVDMQYYTGRR